MSEASTSTTNGLLVLGWTKMGAEVKRSFKVVKAVWASEDQVKGTLGEVR